MGKVVRSIAVGLTVAAGWLMIGWLIFVRDVGSYGLVSAAGMSALILFFGIPVATFTPLTRRWDAPLYQLEAGIGWGCLAAVLTFVRPEQTPPTWQALALLAPLTVAWATLMAAGAYCVARRLTAAGARPAFVDARRRGYLAAIASIALVLLAGLGVLSPAVAVLITAMCIMLEVLYMARGKNHDNSVTRPIAGMRQ